MYRRCSINDLLEVCNFNPHTEQVIHICVEGNRRKKVLGFLTHIFEKWAYTEIATPQYYYLPQYTECNYINHYKHEWPIFFVGVINDRILMTLKLLNNSISLNFTEKNQDLITDEFFKLIRNTIKAPEKAYRIIRPYSEAYEKLALIDNIRKMEIKNEN